MREVVITIVLFLIGLLLGITSGPAHLDDMAHEDQWVDDIDP